jgi:two-component system, chemotaxis family, chemotaxis protein CheY
MKTLIVEDDFTCRLLLQGFLSGFGECHIAVNGNEAVAAFGAAASRGDPYDLICMDIVMPEMNGKDALTKIRALEEERGISSSRGAKIIMTTSLTALKDVIGSFRALCDAYLTKPIDTAELLERLKSLKLIA